jgi:choline kinase
VERAKEHRPKKDDGKKKRGQEEYMTKALRNVGPAKRDPRHGNVTVIILSANIGRRMKAYGVRALFPIHGETPIIEFQLTNTKRVFPDCDVIVVTGFQEDKVRAYLQDKFSVRYVYNHDYEHSNVAHSLALGMRAALPSNLLLVNGDIVFNHHTLQGVNTQDSSCAVVVRNADMNRDVVGVGANNGELSTLSYGLPDKWAQIAYVRMQDVHFIHDVLERPQTRTWFMYEVLNVALKKGMKMKMYEPRNAYVGEVDRLLDIPKIRKALEVNKAK